MYPVIEPPNAIAGKLREILLQQASSFDSLLAEGTSVPSQSCLASVVELCFELSLLSEEGAWVRPTVLLTDTARAVEKCSSLAFHRFEAPAQASLLAKLRLTGSRRQSMLVLETNDDLLRMVGFAYQIKVPSVDERATNEGESEADEIEHADDIFLRFQIDGGLSFVVASKYGAIVSVSHGQMRGRVPQALFHEKQSPVPMIERLREVNAPLRARYSNSKMLPDRLLVRLARKVRDGRHGGLFLFSMDEAYTPVVDGKSLAPIDLGELARELADASWVHSIRRLSPGVTRETRSKLRELRLAVEIAEDRFDSAIEFTAALCGIDGAVVFDQRLRAISFGAKVKSRRTKIDSHRLTFDQNGKLVAIRHDVSERGTRHRAAIEFVGSHEMNMALVCSHDGAVHLVFRLKRKTVLCPIEVDS